MGQTDTSMDQMDQMEITVLMGNRGVRTVADYARLAKNPYLELEASLYMGEMGAMVVLRDTSLAMGARVIREKQQEVQPVVLVA